FLFRLDLLLVLSCFSFSCRSPGSSLFPYTTLFRSRGQRVGDRDRRVVLQGARSLALRQLHVRLAEQVLGLDDGARLVADRSVLRSEEHTSELQSHLNLVCRLLLEKKKLHLKTQSR